MSVTPDSQVQGRLVHCKVSYNQIQDRLTIDSLKLRSPRSSEIKSE